jgi:hypothetical protein
MMPLGSEAKILAAFLRSAGGDGRRAALPGLTSDAERRDWMERGSRFAECPMWALDYAVAILEQIPDREDRPRGRRREDTTAQVERLSLDGSPVAKGAKIVAELEAALATGAAVAALDATLDEKFKTALDAGMTEAEAIKALETAFKAALNAGTIGQPPSRRAITARADELARRVYRQSRRDVP